MAARAPGTGCAWGVGDQLAQFSESDTWGEVRVQYFQENRKLISDGHFLFLNLQQSVRKPWSSEERKAGMLYEISRRYRAIMVAQQKHLKQLCAESDGVAASRLEQYKSQVVLWDRALQLWHLYELCYVIPTSRVVLALVAWYEQFSPVTRRLLRHLERWNESSRAVNQQPEYWHFIFSYDACLIQGHLRNAQDLLSLHEHMKSDHPVTDVFDLLGEMPAMEELSQPNFNAQFQKWRKAVSRTRAKWERHASQEVLDVLLILSGEWYTQASDSDLHSIIPSLRTHDVYVDWKNVLVASVLYCYPSTTNVNLHSRLSDVAEFEAGGVSLQAIVSEGAAGFGDNDALIMEFDRAMMDAIDRTPEERLPMAMWFVAHLGDFLFHCGALAAYEADFRENILARFATQLCTLRTCWQQAADYFSQCAVNGRRYLKLFISRIEIDSEKKGHKVIHLCRKHGLLEEERVVLAIMGRRALQHGRFGASIHWYLLAENNDRVASVAMKFMHEYMRAEMKAEEVLEELYSKHDHVPMDRAKLAKDENLAQMFEIDSIVRSLSPLKTTNNKLAFLLKYCELNTLFRSSQYSQAGEAVVELLTNGVAPKRFWFHILYRKALPLLEREEEVIFNPDATCALMQAMEEIQMSHRKDYLSPWEGEDAGEQQGSGQERAEKQLQELRYALVQNLSRALVTSAHLPFVPMLKNVHRW